MEEAELLPCPFCGGKPILYESDSCDGFYNVLCAKCGAHVGRTDIYEPPEYGTTKEEVVALWNHRACECWEDVP